MTDKYLYSVMEERENLLDQRQLVMAELNALTDKLQAINNLIAADPYIKENNLAYWQWQRGIGFPPAKQKPINRKPRISKSKLDDLIKLVNKKEQEQEIRSAPLEESVSIKKPLQFTYYPDIMEEKAYRHPELTLKSLSPEKA